MRATRSTLIIAVLAAAGATAPAAFAAQPATVPAPAAGASNMPPMAPESAAETRNKQIVVDWFRLCFEQGKAAEAFPKYVSRSFVEHSRRMRGNYDSALAGLSKMGARGDMKIVAAIDDDMVTLNTKVGIDIFRVKDGRITDHWEGNP